MNEINSKKVCPKCGKTNTDDWPIKVSKGIKWGGCQMCWELECDEGWWAAVNSLQPKPKEN